MVIETAVLVAVVIGLVQVLKGLGVNGNMLPLAAVVIGLVLNVGLTYFSDVLGGAVLGGIMAGLMAVGLYEQGKQASKLLGIGKPQSTSYPH